MKWTDESDAEHSTFKYSLPINSTSLHFIARTILSGRVDYVLADKDASPDNIDVTLTLSAQPLTGAQSPVWKIASTPSWLFPQLWPTPKKPCAQVCRLKLHSSEDSAGVGILVRFMHIKHRSDAHSQPFLSFLIRLSPVGSAVVYRRRMIAPSRLHPITTSHFFRSAR